MREMIEVCAIQRLCVHDGPGIRTTVFLRGCYLCCPWCCNPETINLGREYFYNRDKCLHEQGIVSSLCKTCERLGGEREKTECPFGAYKQTFEIYSASELLNILLEDYFLFQDSHGGITFSGGDPFFQANRIHALFQLLSMKGVNIAVETSCCFPHEFILLLDKYIDLYLVDLKIQYNSLTKESKDRKYALNFDLNLGYLQANNRNVIYRLVYIPELMDTRDKVEHVIDKISELRIRDLQILPYHDLASTKYKQLGLEPPKFSIPKIEELEQFGNDLNKIAVKYEILRI